MDIIDSFLIFCVEEVRYALEVAAVKRIVRATEVTFLPEAPDSVRGLINVAGEIIPVIDMRQRLGLAGREMELSDRFILSNMAGMSIALLVDRVEGVVELPIQSVTSVKTAVQDTVTKAVTVEGNIVLIQPLEALVSEVALLQLVDIGLEDINE
ncbi:chemotaxis protein CheW [Desulfosporosinus sp. Sb-LF]|uniref:chemotaxis protein CheW n=1 Tax=Desulfosporosinus sp. Sb-LF TaxID=2560027 RepID=UPI00107F7601|nr:chemotaxis protein CheW [Desulfosporosinus sp. Sb-LF]TGE32162.1 purine-binding chemotaxis protein CheW [Desulfosporosinus sp. Sb-LF]